MKELLKKFSNQMLSKQQLKSIKGGGTYCQCPGGLRWFNHVTNPNQCGSACTTVAYPCPGNPSKWC
jgi:hypothetical protein